MKEQGFEERLSDAQVLLEKLMDPEITLDASVKLYGEGLATIKEAQTLIEKAKTEITVIEQSNQTLGDEG